MPTAGDDPHELGDSGAGKKTMIGRDAGTCEVRSRARTSSCDSYLFELLTASLVVSDDIMMPLFDPYANSDRDGDGNIDEHEVLEKATRRNFEEFIASTIGGDARCAPQRR